MPLSRGAQITYLENLEDEALARALENGQVTGTVGAPALSDSFRLRRLMKIRTTCSRPESFAAYLIDANGRLRQDTPLEFGPMLTLAIRLGFGRQIRYYISGGAALSEANDESPPRARPRAR